MGSGTSSRGSAAWILLLGTIVVVGFCNRRPVTQTVEHRVPALAMNAVANSQAPARSDISTQYYVAVDSLNVRDADNGKVIGSLARGTMVDVYATVGEWARISKPDAAPRWVSAPRICFGEGCASRPVIKSTPVIRSPAIAPNFARPTVTRRSYVGSASSCPCSSSSNCYGPRGGRYCITSGGNKRYR